MLNNALKEIIRSEAVVAEKTGGLTDKQLEIIYENKWFHLLVPKEYGGEEMDLPSFALLMEQFAVIDGSFAWNVNLGAGANMFAGYMDRETAMGIFRDPKTCIAGSGAVSGIAKRVGDQFIIDGQWKYASGSGHANFFSLNALLEEGEGQSVEFSSFIVPVQDVELLDTWKTSGLKASASHDFKVEGAEIPATYAFDLLKPSPNNTGLLYRFSFQILAEINMLVMSTGLAIRFLELVKEIANHQIVRNENRVLAEHPRYKRVLDHNENEFSQARLIVFRSLDLLWEKSGKGEEILLEEQKAFTHEILEAAEKSRQLVDSLSAFMGMHMVFEATEINRVWRDFKTASQHALLSPARFQIP